MSNTAFQLAKLLANLYKVTEEVYVHQSVLNSDEMIVSGTHYWYGSKERNPDILHVTIKSNILSNIEQQDDYIELRRAIDFSLKEIEEKVRTDKVKTEALSKLSDEEKAVLGLS